MSYGEIPVISMWDRADNRERLSKLAASGRAILDEEIKARIWQRPLVDSRIERLEYEKRVMKDALVEILMMSLKQNGTIKRCYDPIRTALEEVGEW